MDDDILGINLINALGMSYDAKAQQIFTISDMEDQLIATGETTISPFSTTTITAKYTGHIDPYATHVVTVMSRRLCHLQGGPALVKLNDHRVCRIPVTNTAPYSVTIGCHKFIGGLDQWNNVDEPQPLDSEMVTRFIHKLETKAHKQLLNPSDSTKLLFTKRYRTVPTSMCLISSKNNTCIFYENIKK